MLSRIEALVRSRGEVEKADALQRLINEQGDVFEEESAKDDVSLELKKALNEVGFSAIYNLLGRSLGEIFETPHMINSSSWVLHHPEVLDIRSRKGLIAINPSQVIASGTSGKSFMKQLDTVAVLKDEFIEKLGEGVDDLVVGNIAELCEITLLHFNQTGANLFGPQIRGFGNPNDYLSVRSSSFFGNDLIDLSAFYPAYGFSISHSDPSENRDNWGNVGGLGVVPIAVLSSDS